MNYIVFGIQRSFLAVFWWGKKQHTCEISIYKEIKSGVLRSIKNCFSYIILASFICLDFWIRFIQFLVAHFRLVYLRRKFRGSLELWFDKKCLRIGALANHLVAAAVIFSAFSKYLTVSKCPEDCLWAHAAASTASTSCHSGLSATEEMAVSYSFFFGVPYKVLKGTNSM